MPDALYSHINLKLSPESETRTPALLALTARRMWETNWKWGALTRQHWWTHAQTHTRGHTHYARAQTHTGRQASKQAARTRCCTLSAEDHACGTCMHEWGVPAPLSSCMRRDTEPYGPENQRNQVPRTDSIWHTRWTSGLPPFLPSSLPPFLPSSLPPSLPSSLPSFLP